MARYQFQIIRETDFGGGIDQQAAENKIPEGFCEDLLNADPQSTGQVSKRKGYQGYAGYIPVRVQEVEYDGTDINLFFSTSIELPPRQSSPLIIFGKTSQGAGDFASETAIYFDNYTADIRKTFNTGTNTITVSEDEHDILQSYDLHANCYITKPIDLAEFIKVINAIENFWLTIVRLPTAKAGSHTKGT